MLIRRALRNMAAARRLSASSLPLDWHVTFPCSQLSLESVNLSKLPALADNAGRLQVDVSAGDEAYALPPDLLLDDVDKLAVSKSSEARDAQRAAAAAEAAAGEAPAAADDENSQDEDEDDEAAFAAAAAASPPATSTPCVSLRLAKNHISAIEAKAFERLPQVMTTDDR